EIFISQHFTPYSERQVLAFLIATHVKAAVVENAWPAVSAAQNSPQEHREELALQGEFAPSSELVALWRENVETTLGRDRSQFAISDRDAAAEFSKSLTSLIGGLAQEYRYSREAPK